MCGLKLDALDVPLSSSFRLFLKGKTVAEAHSFLCRRFQMHIFYHILSLASRLHPVSLALSSLQSLAKEGMYALLTKTYSFKTIIQDIHLHFVSALQYTDIVLPFGNKSCASGHSYQAITNNSAVPRHCCSLAVTTVLFSQCRLYVPC